MACLPVKKLSYCLECVYEFKFDGYRVQAIREVKGVQLLSGNGTDLNKRFRAGAGWEWGGGGSLLA